MALGEVSNSLASIQSDAHSYKAQVKAKKAARQSLELAHQRYQAGAIGFLALFTAQEQYQHAIIAFTQARMQRFLDTAILFRSLGGGWWKPKQIKNEAGAPSQAQGHNS